MNLAIIGSPEKWGLKCCVFPLALESLCGQKVAGKDQTEYVLAAIPLGGYVKMLDEREAPVEGA